MQTIALDEVFLDRLKTKVIASNQIKLKRVSGGFRLLIPAAPKGYYIRFLTDEAITEIFRSFSPYKWKYEGANVH